VIVPLVSAALLWLAGKNNTHRVRHDNRLLSQGDSASPPSQHLTKKNRERDTDHPSSSLIIVTFLFPHTTIIIDNTEAQIIVKLKLSPVFSV